MKKILLTLTFALALNSVSAQTETVETKNSDFNKWSVEFAGGFNKYQQPVTPGYATDTPNLFVGDLGVRYMFNNQFGLKADFGFNTFEEASGSNNFSTRYYRVDLQAVANLGRIMNFETWTNTIGLLGHAGFGVAQLEDQNSALKDKMGNFIAGVTGQIKLTNRIALTGDFTTIINARQNANFDGAQVNPNGGGFRGILFNGTVGVTVYLGKNAKHADWVVLNDDRFSAIDARFMAIENKMLDSDKDGVADYLDEEANTPAGSLVDTKGKSIDKNNNGVPDATEDFIIKNYGSGNTSPLLSNNELITSLINGGYVATYYDFNQSTPTNDSTGNTDFILTYLRNNPSASVEITGHADEIGSSAYNDKLSKARATNVKNTLTAAGIAESRLNIVAAGEDTSVNKDSDAARKLVRKVTYRVK